MLCRSFALSLALAAGAAILLSLAVVGGSPKRAQGEPPAGIPPTQLVVGDAALVEGSLVVTWARVHRGDVVKEVGVTIPVDLFDNQPTKDGTGPSGAIASLVFPKIVRDTTYFNHFELHTEPEGHVAPPGSVNPDRNRVPHFDFHFYAIDEEDVRPIPATFPPLPPVPARLLPAGYVPAGPSLAEMGRHSSPLTALLDPDPLTTVMIAGFMPAGDEMHFIEPMVSREFLLERNNFELPVPMPEEFGRLMFYPTKFTAEYDADIDAYHFIFSKFVVVE